MEVSGFWASGTTQLKMTFRAFRARNYRLFFTGQGISLIGTWAQQVAMSWLVYRLTGSTLLLGIVAFSSSIPSLFLGPIAGWAADRWDQKYLLIGTQVFSMLQALILSALVLMHLVQIWHIIALSIFIGIVNAFDIPIRQSFVIKMVDKKEDLGNAIALNSALFHSARFIGPSVAGLLISSFGEGVCFLLNAISYIAVIAALIAIRVGPNKNRNKKIAFFQEILEGFSYAYNFKPIIALLALLALFSLAGAPYLVLMPAFAKDVLNGDAQTFGFLVSSTGFGAVAATIYLAARKSVKGLITLIPLATGICGLGILALSFSGWFPLAIAFLFLTGLGMMIQVAGSNTIIQTIVDEDKRGRVMGLFAMFFLGVMPIGSLLAGSIAGKIGVQNTFILCSVCCILGASVFSLKLPMLRKQLRPVFSDMNSPELEEH